MDKELGNIPEVGMKARFMDDEEALGMVDSMATEDTKLLGLLVDSLEACVKSGDRRQYKAACEMLGINTDNRANEEVEVMGHAEGGYIYSTTDLVKSF
jgi:hypothetical protein